ncbi:probable ATP-dependent RNA helicase DHX34 isoform X2 [Ornithodoros turicata]|uniref:probable ATP-dependent RNA helicase DHX34 isoform X2 n=1 Tax=Ornithodoros turicata TaxID=34597 RepID=UPI0031389014
MEGRREHDKHKKGRREKDKLSRVYTKKSHHKRERLEESSRSRPAAEHVRDVPQEAEKDFSRFRREISSIFFGDSSPILRDSKQYNDFWTFLKKYQTQKHKHCSQDCSEHDRPSISLGIPQHYNPVYKVNISVFSGSARELMLNAGIVSEYDSRESLQEVDVEEVRKVFHLYLNFLEKQKFDRLIKLREFQRNLPIAQHRGTILGALKENQVVLVAGDTGCGKSTQIPQYLLDAGYEGIVCTQPRRIAAISLCKRVAFETLNEYGTHIGYQIRFEKHRSKHTKMLFVTEGLLLRLLSGDAMLKDYKVILLDEIHERHLTCDILLGVIKCLVQHRDDLKVILMSATINIQLFARYFHNCQVVQVPGRLFPISIQHIPVPKEELRSKSGRLNPAPYVRLLNLIDQKYPSTERGDLLVFLSGTAEISAVQEAAQQYADQNGNWIILPLHSTLPLADQDKVFDYAPENMRKCILSTNIAETSVTIDGVRFVADSGKVKEMSYDAGCHMQKLKEFWISQASAEQRKGRAGRTGPGVCFRLFSETEYEAMAPYSTPEILRVPLHSLLLQLISLGLPDVRQFPFLEPPPVESILESLRLLKDQGALTEEEELTQLGKILGQLPVDITVGKILVLGCLFRLEDPVLSLAAALSVQTPFTQKSFRDASTARKEVDSDHGDALTLLNAFHQWLSLKCSGENSTKWCRRLGLEEQRFYELMKLRQQFLHLLEEAGLVEERTAETCSSSERMERHGELKKLRNLRRQLLLQRGSRKRCILDLNNDQEDAEDSINLGDVNFRLRQDPSELQSLLQKSRGYSLRDLKLLKTILCAGVYPQVALPDDHNSYKRDSDQLFHTKGKGFVVLHPNSVLALDPDVLKLDDMNVHVVPAFGSKRPVSTDHQMVTYMSLLETVKPYLVNCVRVCCVQTLLLASSAIDSSCTVARLVFDEFVEVVFPDPEAACQLVLKAVHARKLYSRLLTRQLEGSRAVLSSGESFEPNPRKGGVLLSENFTYGCLEETALAVDPFTDCKWQCHICNKEFPFSVLSSILHLEECDKGSENETTTVTTEQMDSCRRAYFCKTCDQELSLTLPEIFKHRRSHEQGDV